MRQSCHLRARHIRHCEKCGNMVQGKHAFANFLYNVLCRGCFYKLAHD
jgi:ribosomal protein S14